PARALERLRRRRRAARHRVHRGPRLRAASSVRRRSAASRRLAGTDSSLVGLVDVIEAQIRMRKSTPDLSLASDPVMLTSIAPLRIAHHPPHANTGRRDLLLIYPPGFGYDFAFVLRICPRCTLHGAGTA